MADENDPDRPADAPPPSPAEKPPEATLEGAPASPDAQVQAEPPPSFDTPLEEAAKAALAALQAQAEPPPLEISEPLFPPTEPAQAEDLVISGGNPSEEMRQPPATLAESPEALGPIAPPTAEGLGDAVSAALEEASASVSEQAAPADETELLETPPEPTEVFFEATLTETVGNAPAPVLEDAATALEEPSHLIAPAPAATFIATAPTGAPAEAEAAAEPDFVQPEFTETGETTRSAPETQEDPPPTLMEMAENAAEPFEAEAPFEPAMEVGLTEAADEAPAFMAAEPIVTAPEETSFEQAALDHGPPAVTETAPAEPAFRAEHPVAAAPEESAFEHSALDQGPSAAAEAVLADAEQAYAAAAPAEIAPAEAAFDPTLLDQSQPVVAEAPPADEEAAFVAAAPNIAAPEVAAFEPAAIENDPPAVSESPLELAPPPAEIIESPTTIAQWETFTPAAEPDAEEILFSAPEPQADTLAEAEAPASPESTSPEITPPPQEAAASPAPADTASPGYFRAAGDPDDEPESPPPDFWRRQQDRASRVAGRLGAA
ncbi:MAG TPA: hypothetical protein DHW63_05325, partial [Hyphomonadaceae bacterium]|nr:hypothetical protein [Hyphomonadaceae bacterium]